MDWDSAPIRVLRIDGAIRWNSRGEDIYNLVRALARPYPGAFGCLNGTEYRVWKAALLPAREPMAPPGTVLGPVLSPEEHACGVLVATADGALLVLELEDNNGRILAGRELCEHHWTRRSLRTAA